MALVSTGVLLNVASTYMGMMGSTGFGLTSVLKLVAFACGAVNEAVLKHFRAKINFIYVVFYIMHNTLNKVCMTLRLKHGLPPGYASFCLI